MAGFDIGTSSAKVLIVSSEGKVLASSAAPVTARTPKPGQLEEVPDEWWSALVRALEAARASLPGGTEIEAIGLSGHMSGLVLLDRDQRPIMPCILLADTRGAEEAAALDDGIRLKITDQTGNCPSTAFTLAKLLWVRRHETRFFSKTAWAMSAKDYVLCRLTGNVSTEPTDAGNYLLLDRSATGWDARLIESLGLPPGIFPPLRLPSQKAGELTARAAAETGLPAGIPVVAGGADMACTAVGSGTLSEGDAAMSLGTASPLIVPTREIDRALIGKLTFHPHALTGSRYALASILSGGRSYQWLKGLLREAGTADVDFQALDGHPGRGAPGSGGVLFLPFLTGTGSPDWRSSGRAAWIGLGAETALPEIARAVLEGVAYNCRECIELCRRQGRQISRIVASGGGAVSGLWLRILADVTGLSVQALEMREASALGAAVLAGVGSGAFADIPEAVSGMVRLKEPIQPDARRGELYGQLYQGYLLAKRQLAGVDDALQAARGGGLPG